jgi:molecular chaperone IbpA
LTDLADMIDNGGQARAGRAAIPPYNIEQLSEHEYRIELAVAGFGED